MKILVAGGTGAIGRPLILELLAKGHSLVALTRSPEKAQALVGQDIEPAIADVFDSDAVKAVLSRAQPEVVIEQLTALPRTYTRESMSAAAAFNTRLRLEGGANVLAAAQAAGVRRYLRQSIAFWAFLVLDWRMKKRLSHLMPHLRWQQTLASSPSSSIAYWEIAALKGLPCVTASFMDPAPGSPPMAMLPDRCDSNSSRSSGTAKASGRGYTLRTRRSPRLQQPSKAILGFI